MREIAGRHRRREFVARGGQQRIEVGWREPSCQLSENCRRLIKPEVANQFGGLRGLFEPGRLPEDAGDEIGLEAEAVGNGARGVLGSFAVRNANGENQLPRVGKILLVDFQPSNRGGVAGQQVQNFDIKSKSSEAERDRNQQHQAEPAAERDHGVRNPSILSPLRLFSSRQRPSSNCFQRQFAGGTRPVRQRARCNQPNRDGGLPEPQNVLFSATNSICQALVVVCATTNGRGVLVN
ncbi:MAG: hypothetical protein DME19_04435 [Verrucomicrobia bacterium]|nr:MAG: hypothetical protein DME19_04435 [Verrucomicrobiota bacterium]